MELPAPFELEYTKMIEQLEGEKHVAYITSVERIGIQKGWQQGHQEGLQEGREETLKELAAQLLQENVLPIDKIAKMTGLSLETLYTLGSGKNDP